MKRVLHIGLTDKRGGIENLLKTLMTHLDSNKVIFDFISEYEQPAYEKLFINSGCVVYHIPKIKHIVSYIKKLNRIIRQYDIVHIHKNSNINIIPFLLCKFNKVNTVIVHSHNAGMSYANKKFIWLHNINRYILNCCKFKRVACGLDAGTWLFGKNTTFEVFHNPIDLEMMHYDMGIRRNMKKTYQNSFVIGHIGRFCEQKNQVYLIKVFKRVLDFDKNCRLIFLGDGEQFNMCKEKVKELNMEGFVEFKGSVDNVHEYLQLFDVFVLPSLYEGLPIVGIEAQATGLPCVFSTNVTKETEVTNLITWFDLNDSIDNIVMKILNVKNINRIDKSEEIKTSGFDIDTALLQLYQLYGIHL